MNTKFFAFIFAVLFSIIPLEAFVSAASLIRLGDAELNEETPYLQNGTAVNYCDLGVDGCSAYLETINPNSINLHLSQYEGAEIEIMGIDNVNVEIKDEARIFSRTDTGIKTDANLLSFTANDPRTTTSLYINTSTNSNTAIGIWNTKGSIDLGSRLWYAMDILSGVPRNVQTTDNVTGITTRLDQRISMALDTQIDIINDTGNYSIYTGRMDTRNESALGGSCSIDTILRATHKTTNGVGNGIYQNDFGGPSLETSIVNIPKTEYTSFKGWQYTILPLFHETVEANYDNNLEYGEDMLYASDRIKNSLGEGDSAEYYFDLEKSGLVVVDDIATGTYHEPTSENVEAENYALKIDVNLWSWDWYAFGPVQHRNAKIKLNGETIDGGRLYYVNFTESYILAPVNLNGALTGTSVVQVTDFTPIIDPAQRDETDDASTEPDSETESESTAQTETTVVLPKAPNTGRK